MKISVNVKRTMVVGVASLLLLLMGVEAFARFMLGLGDPPLYVTDPRIEYMMKPDQDVMRFGNRVYVNHWGMRASDISQHKANPEEIRVLVVGDSVVNGGSQIDQGKLSVTLLEQMLRSALKVPVLVGNASAPSWGPGNWLAYVQKYGLFDADLVILVVNSGDYADNPTFEPLKATHPTQKPIFAFYEGATRYLPRYFPDRGEVAQNALPAPPSAQDAQRGMTDLRHFLTLAGEGGRKVMIFHHPDRPESQSGRYFPGHDEMRALADSLSIPFVDLMGGYAASGAMLYRDGIHHNEQGQLRLAELMFESALPVLQSLHLVKARE